MAIERIELTSDQKTQEAEVARPSDLSVDEGLENIGDARTLNQLASEIQLAGAGWATLWVPKMSSDLLARDDAY